MRQSVLAGFAFASACAAGPASATDPFDRPWSRSGASIVIDAYERNDIDWEQLQHDPRVVGIIHRASIGLRDDVAYGHRAQIAESRGYLWGAYHLGRSGEPIAQADFFLEQVGDPEGVLLALDLEAFDREQDMSIDEAIAFIARIRERVGRSPIVYGNDRVIRRLSDDYAFRTAARGVRLWYARFRADIPDFPDAMWSEYFLWQFSSEVNCRRPGRCLYSAPGVQHDMDFNVAIGDRASIAARWAAPDPR